MAQLRAEYSAALRVMPIAAACELEALGIPRTAIAAVCPVPIRIAVNRAGDRFWPNDGGELGWVFPVAVVDPGRPELIETEDPFATVQTGPIIDLAATTRSPVAPGPWALRRGLATVAGAIPPQYMDPEPVRVHRDIAAWLRAGCRGIVLLSDDPDEVQRVLCQIRCIEIDDPEPEDWSRVIPRSERVYVSEKDVVSSDVHLLPRPAARASGMSSGPAAQSAKPWNRHRLEGLVRKIITTGQPQRQGTLRWACHVLGAAAGKGEIAPELARALLIRAGIRAGLGERATQRLVATSFPTIGGLSHEGERRWPRPI
jgi:hypothetical protein